MLFTGERISAQRAYECGLISHIASGDLEEFTAKLANDIAQSASTTLFLGKRGFYQQKDMGIVKAYDFAGEIMARNFCLRDSQEGVTAFFDKREPEWG